MNTTRIEMPRAQRIEESGKGGRRRNVLKGEDLVTPVRVLDLNVDGRWETIRPGRHRFALVHPAVKARPEVFTPCMEGDKPTAARLREMLGRAEREELRAIGQQRRGSAPRPPRGSWRLPEQPAGKWRLP